MQASASFETHQKLKMARKSGLSWFIKDHKGILEYTQVNYFKSLLIFWLLYALLSWLVSFAFPTRSEFICQREAASSGTCQLRNQSLHPLKIFFPSTTSYPLQTIKGVRVVEYEGDESDSYEVVIDTPTAAVRVFSPWTEAGGEEIAEDIDFFLKNPTESSLRINSVNHVYLWMFDIPVWFLSIQLLAALVLRQAGRPFKSERIILDPARRQMIKLKIGAWGGFHAQQSALASVRKLIFTRNQGENSLTYQFQIEIKGSKNELAFSAFSLKSEVSESYLEYLCQQFNDFIAQEQARTTQENPGHSKAKST